MFVVISELSLLILSVTKSLVVSLVADSHLFFITCWENYLFLEINVIETGFPRVLMLLQFAYRTLSIDLP